MGTNFYWKTEYDPVPKITLPSGVEVSLVLAEDMDSPVLHIGKRSAAGMYCWDCGLTLCKGGESAIHTGDSDWYDTCPKCGKQPVIEGLNSGPVALELGFSQPRHSKPTGVYGCSSFTWTQEPAAVVTACEANLEVAIVVDEYDREYTGNQFLSMLESNCPVRFTDMIGRVFS